MADLDEVVSTGRVTLAALMQEAKTQPPLNQTDDEPDEQLDENELDNDVVGFLDQHMDRNGQPSGRFRKSKNNLYVILRRDRRWRNRIWLNRFTNTLKIDDRDYRDSDDTRISLWVGRAYGLEYSEAYVSSIVELIGEERSRNPLTEWLDTLDWDGQRRIHDWIVHATDCEDNDLNRKMGEKWLIQAIARAYRPGCKADCVLILAGAQGAGKSTLFRTIATDEYFADTPLDIGSANSYSQIARAWIYEVAELDSVRRSANSATKAFLSAQEDTYRAAYGRHAKTVKRHVVFAGTTNESQFINDMTGSRRYWPIRCNEVDLEYVDNNRDQLWAEAIVAFNAGDTWWLDRETDKDRHHSSHVFRQEDPWLNPVAEYLLTQVNAVTTQMVMEDGLKIDRGRMNRRDEMRVSDILTELGYTKTRMRVHGRRKYVWSRLGMYDINEKEA